jgi:integrase/recombinase XerD
MLLRVHRGKGAKDRFVPLPAATSSGLRRHWRTHRHPRLIFPALGRGRNRAAAADSPMPRSRVPGAFRLAKSQAGIHKRRVSVPTLRHS